jgi:hypothetical protein
MVAIPQQTPVAIPWVSDVFSMVEVAASLEFLGFISPENADRLASESTTIVPLDGFDTVSIRLVADVVGIVHPEIHDIGDEAKEGHLLIAKGETTEERLAAAGFIVKMKGHVQ